MSYTLYVAFSMVSSKKPRRLLRKLSEATKRSLQSLNGKTDEVGKIALSCYIICYNSLAGDEAELILREFSHALIPD